MPDAGADAARNRDLWMVVNAQFTDEDADRAWAAAELTWGLFQVPERELGVLVTSASFDLVVSEYGASVWCDPRRWVAEAARLLRPGRRLVFLTNSVLATLCVPDDEGFASERLVRPQRGLHRVQWPGGGVEFHPSHGEWIRVLDANGFLVQALHELYAPTAATTHLYYGIATAQWASRWPVEDLWATRLIG